MSRAWRAAEGAGLEQAPPRGPWGSWGSPAAHQLLPATRQRLLPSPALFPRHLQASRSPAPESLPQELPRSREGGAGLHCRRLAGLQGTAPPFYYYYCCCCCYFLPRLPVRGCVAGAVVQRRQFLPTAGHRLPGAVFLEGLLARPISCPLPKGKLARTPACPLLLWGWAAPGSGASALRAPSRLPAGRQLLDGDAVIRRLVQSRH